MLGSLAANTVQFIAARSAGTSLLVTVNVGFYTAANATSLALVSSTSNAVSLTASTQYSGTRMYIVTGLGALTLTQGRYWMGLLVAGTGTNSFDIALMGAGSVPTLAGSVFAGTDQTSGTATSQLLRAVRGRLQRGLLLPARQYRRLRHVGRLGLLPTPAVLRRHPAYLMAKPQIIMPDVGAHNRDLAATRTRLLKGQSYRDLSTVCVIPLHPGREGIHPRVVQAWMNLMPPMNQKFTRIFMTGMEVGDAYTAAVESILAHPELSTWRYMLTLEDDNLPRPTACSSCTSRSRQARMPPWAGSIGPRGVGAMPMIYGDPAVMPRNFIPQLPMPEAVQPCNGLGMGFTLFRLSIFKDPKFMKPWFKTVQELVPGKGYQSYTQDLWAFSKMAEPGIQGGE